MGLRIMGPFIAVASVAIAGCNSPATTATAVGGQEQAASLRSMFDNALACWTEHGRHLTPGNTSEEREVEYERGRVEGVLFLSARLLGISDDQIGERSDALPRSPADLDVRRHPACMAVNRALRDTSRDRAAH